jgi:lactoylglutathione lyase
VIELTHIGGDREYSHGTGFGHVALGVTDVYGAARALADAGVRILRAAGPLVDGCRNPRNSGDGRAFAGSGSSASHR